MRTMYIVLALFALASLSTVSAGEPPAKETHKMQTEKSALQRNAIEMSKAVVPVFKREADQSLKLIATAFFIDQSGMLLTAAHVVPYQPLFTVFDNKIRSLTVVLPELKLNNAAGALVYKYDIALLGIQGDEIEFPCVTLSTKTRFDPGEPVAIWGFYQQGSNFQVGKDNKTSALLTVGVVSCAFYMSAGEEEWGSRLWLDITAGPGSSGSPVFNPETGEVIGIVSEGKVTPVLSPSQNKNELIEREIPMGIAVAESVITPLRLLPTWRKEVRRAPIPPVIQPSQSPTSP